jgi:hypothetical protein
MSIRFARWKNVGPQCWDEWRENSGNPQELQFGIERNIEIDFERQEKRRSVCARAALCKGRKRATELLSSM